MNKTKIEWVKNPDGTQGYTWNPITGCLNGCSYCYARKLANGRLKQRYLANIEGIYVPATMKSELQKRAINPFYPRFWHNRIVDPNQIKKPAGIFVCDMGELFGDWLPRKWQEAIFITFRQCPQHRFYLLTKCPKNLSKWSPFPPNVYLGVTVTNQEMFDKAIDYLKLVDAKVKFLSFEPLLEHIMSENLDGISWVIIGAQTKPTVYPKIMWVEEIVRACDKVNVPVFLKNNLYPLLGLGDGKSICHNNEIGTLRQEMPSSK